MSKSTCWLRPPEQQNLGQWKIKSIYPGLFTIAQWMIVRNYTILSFGNHRDRWPYHQTASKTCFSHAAHLGWWCHLHWQSQSAGVSSGNSHHLSEGHKLHKTVPGKARPKQMLNVSHSGLGWDHPKKIEWKSNMLKPRPSKLRMCTTDVYRWYNLSQSHIPYSSKNRFSKQWRMRIGPQYHPRHARVRTGCWQRHKSKRTTPKPVAFCMLLPVASEAKCKMTQQNCTKSPHKCQFLSNCPNGRRTLWPTVGREGHSQWGWLLHGNLPTTAMLDVWCTLLRRSVASLKSDCKIPVSIFPPKQKTFKRRTHFCWSTKVKTQSVLAPPMRDKGLDYSTSTIRSDESFEVFCKRESAQIVTVFLENYLVHDFVQIHSPPRPFLQSVLANTRTAKSLGLRGAAQLGLVVAMPSHLAKVLKYQRSVYNPISTVHIRPRYHSTFSQQEEPHLTLKGIPHKGVQGKKKNDASEISSCASRNCKSSFKVTPRWSEGNRP